MLINIKRSFNVCATNVQLVITLVLSSCICVFAGFTEINNNVVKITQHGLELTQTMNIQRQEHLQKQCENSGDEHSKSIESLTLEQMDHLIVDRQHKFLYCYVPKVACTNWKRVLMILTGKWKNGTDPLQIPGSQAHERGLFDKFSSLNKEEQNRVMTEYTRFILVRHPFERLLSAFRNKFEGETASSRYFQKHFGRQIVRNVRQNASNESLQLGNDVTFSEFVYYLLKPENQSSTYNEHWEPIYKLCNPCVMKYNAIGKYETLIDDSALALHLAGAKDLTFPAGHKPSNTRANLRHYFDPLPVKAIRLLYNIYAEDFRLFDYNLDDVLGFEFG